MSVETAGYYTMRCELDTRSETIERPTMLRGIHGALVIYNPTSGRRRGARLGALEAALRALKQAGIAAELAPSTAPGSATELARRAVAEKRHRGDEYRKNRHGHGDWREVVLGSFFGVFFEFAKIFSHLAHLSKTKLVLSG